MILIQKSLFWLQSISYFFCEFSCSLISNLIGTFLRFLFLRFARNRVLQQGQIYRSVTKYCAHKAHHFCPLEYLRFPGRNFENLFIFWAVVSFLNLSQRPEQICAIFSLFYVVYFQLIYLTHL